MVDKDRTPSPAMPTVKFDRTRVTDAVQADLRDNIATLDDINASDVPTLFNAALKAIYAGGDLHSLSKALKGLGIGARRAAEISRYLYFNAQALMEAERREQLGIQFAIWQYSGAPCGNAEQDSAHKAANGKRFPVSEGLYLNGRFTLPGREFECKCTSKAIIPGFEE